MFTIVPSSTTTMSWASPMTARIHQRSGDGGPADGSADTVAAPAVPVEVLGMTELQRMRGRGSDVRWWCGVGRLRRRELAT
ncbi:hypothetical protein SPURM210S_07318 [Streptomyces purpurascens]